MQKHLTGLTHSNYNTCAHHYYYTIIITFIYPTDSSYKLVNWSLSRKMHSVRDFEHNCRGLIDPRLEKSEDDPHATWFYSKVVLKLSRAMDLFSELRS